MIFQQLQDTLNIIKYVIFALFIGGWIIFFVSKKRRKNQRIKEDEVDYSGLNRKDTLDYIKLDDIKDGMISVENGRRFIGAIKCQGFDFNTAQEGEQALIAQNFFGFVNTINKPITYRQYCKAIDLEDTILMYKEAYDKVMVQLFNVTEDIKHMEKVMKTESGMSDDDINWYSQSLEEMEYKKRSLNNRKFHLEDQISYAEKISGNSVSPENKETWIFDWTFDPLDFSVDLNDEEIYQRAIKELNAIARAKIHSLSSCRVKAYRCTTEDLIEMCRRYSSPISSDRFRIRDVARSSFFDDIVQSTSVHDMIQKGKETAIENDIIKFGSMFEEGITIKNDSIPIQQEEMVKCNSAIEPVQFTSEGKTITNIITKPESNKVNKSVPKPTVKKIKKQNKINQTAITIEEGI